MKYIKNYTTYINESSEKNNKNQFGFSVMSLFNPFINMFSNMNTDKKLKDIIISFDDYLYAVYEEYVARKTHTNNLENSDIKEIGQDNEIHIDDNDYNDNDFDDDIIATEVDDTSKNSEPIKYSSKNHVNRKVSFMNKEDIEYFTDMLDEYIDENDSDKLEEFKREYEIALKQDSDLLVTTKGQISSYNKLRNKAIDSNIKAKHGSIEQENAQQELKNLGNTLTSLGDKVQNLNIKIEQHKWYISEINKALSYMSDNKVSIEKTNESSDWKGGGVIDYKWTEHDMEKVNSLINPFQIEEYFLKANVVIEKSNNPEKFQHKWDMYLNTLYKKWYYTFDVKGLKNITPKLNSIKNKNEIKTKEELVYFTLILESIFPKIESYSYPFKYIKNDKNLYFILLNKNNMLLIKKVIFNNNTYSFQLLSQLVPNKENNGIVISKLLNTTDDNTIIINDTKLKLFKEKKNYPIFFIEGGDMYVSEDFKKFNDVSLKNCNIYSLKETDFKKIFKESHVAYSNIPPSNETFEKIKKTII